LNFRVIRIPAATAITIEKITSRVSKADQEELETSAADVSSMPPHPCGQHPASGSGG
jgi:hypothetical protein